MRTSHLWDGLAIRPAMNVQQELIPDDRSCRSVECPLDRIPLRAWIEEAIDEGRWRRCQRGPLLPFAPRKNILSRSGRRQWHVIRETRHLNRAAGCRLGFPARRD